MKKNIARIVAVGLGLISAFAFVGCQTKNAHEHTYEWIKNKYTHQQVYTCGCESADIAEMHADGDGDAVCDICGYGMSASTHEHTGMWATTAGTHSYVYTCGCPSPAVAEEHTNQDGDTSCDVCGYIMKERDCAFEWVGTQEGHYMHMLCDCCDDPEEIAYHENWDGDSLCDICGYDIPVISEE